MDYYKESEKQILRYYQSKDKLICLRLELEHIAEVQALDITKEKVKTSRVGSGVEEEVLHKEKLETEIMELEAFIAEIDFILHSLQPEQRDLIKRNYSSKKYRTKKYRQALEVFAARFFGLDALYHFNPEMKSILRL